MYCLKTRVSCPASASCFVPFRHFSVTQYSTVPTQVFSYAVDTVMSLWVVNSGPRERENGRTVLSPWYPARYGPFGTKDKSHFL